jgi:hypothetical protein
MTTRKCENWLQSFREWIVPRSEAPESYVFWAGAFTLASALRRRAFIGESSLGGWTCFPHIYTMFVGPPGMRKTTAFDFGNKIMSQVPEIIKSPSLITKESLVNSILTSPDSSLSMVVGEFSDLILKGGKEMYDLLTSLYDAKKELSVATMMRGKEGTERPCFNFGACTTPGWISTHMPEESISGGFASRVIFIYEAELGKKRLYWQKEMSNGGIARFDKIEADLVQDLSHIAQNLAGEYKLTEEALKNGEDWYQSLSLVGVSKKMHGYMSRKHVHAHKLAMLLTAAQSDELVIEWQTLEMAINILTQTEKRLPLVFAGVGKNAYSLTLRDIKDFIQVNGQVTRAQLYNHFQSNAEPRKLGELVEGLIAMKAISNDLVDNDFLYTYIGG